MPSRPHFGCKRLLNEDHVQPALEFPPDLRKVADALEAERFVQRDARDGFAAATADDGMVIEHTGAFHEIDNDRAPDTASMPVVAHVNRKLRRLPVRRGGAERPE